MQLQISQNFFHYRRYRRYRKYRKSVSQILKTPFQISQILAYVTEEVQTGINPIANIADIADIENPIANIADIAGINLHD